jgi:hypothetical protein
MKQPEEWRERWLQAMGDVVNVGPEELEKCVQERMLSIISKILADGQLDGRAKGLKEAAAKILPSNAEVAQELYETAFQLEELGR